MRSSSVFTFSHTTGVDWLAHIITRTSRAIPSHRGQGLSHWSEPSRLTRSRRVARRPSNPSLQEHRHESPLLPSRDSWPSRNWKDWKVGPYIAVRTAPRSRCHKRAKKYGRFHDGVCFVVMSRGLLWEVAEHIRAQLISRNAASSDEFYGQALPHRNLSASAPVAYDVLAHIKAPSEACDATAGVNGLVKWVHWYGLSRYVMPLSTRYVLDGEHRA